MFPIGLSVRRTLPLVLSLATLLTAAVALAVTPAKIKQKVFASPEEAVKALSDAVRKSDEKGLFAIFGPGSGWLIHSGDAVDDKNRRDSFLKAYEEKNNLMREGEDKVIVVVGNKDYPFAIPIVKQGGVWFFDTKAGKEELLNRRIGRDELKAIELLHAYVDAQRDYAARDRNSDGIPEFAQKIVSSKEVHDGLYWKAKEGEEESPLGPLVARAAAEGYTGKAGADTPAPYHGYHFKILKGQGKSANGGAYDYVANKRMILGFAMVAYPERYGSSGIMTFIVNQEGIVYEKDFGKNTTKLARAIRTYDPDSTWKKVEETKP